MLIIKAIQVLKVVKEVLIIKLCRAKVILILIMMEPQVIICFKMLTLLR